jgi:hypothetical protein
MEVFKMEQTPFPITLSIRLETENYPLKLGRNNMKFRPVALLLGAVLFAAVPVLADGIPNPGLTKESHSIPFLGKLDSNNGFDFRAPEPLIGLDNLFSGKSDTKVDRASLSALIGSERGSFEWHGGDVWSPSDGDGNGPKDNDDPKAIPEPGAFSLLLLGLAAVGLFALRRTPWTKTT